MSRVDLSDDKPSRFNSNTVGLAFLAIAFSVSLVIVVRNTISIERPSKPVLRICHWQLEAGYRDALQTLIDDYAKLHPEIDVVQMPVTEHLYKQWVNTQLISNTAPDICEMGQSDLLSKDEGTVRYFLPLSGEIVKTNPYNKGTDIENLAWKDTLLDGMRGGFREGLQDYYGVSTTLTSMRVFYNKDLLAKAINYYNAVPQKDLSQPKGSATAGEPKTFGQWMAQCRAIKAYAVKTREPLLPIVSCYGLVGIQQKLEIPFTAKLAADCDLDLDGNTSDVETYIGYLQKKFDLDTPAIRQLYETVHQVGRQMQQGFGAMDRQTAQFRFVNGQAGFMWTGSWDANGTFMQAATKGFQVGVFQVPIPGPDESNGQLVAASAGEIIAGAGTYGINKTSTRIKEAIDFLQFITSQKANEKLNQMAGWPPLTIGAKPSERMVPFVPDLRGLNTRLNPIFGSRVNQDAGAELLNFYQDDSTYEQYKTSYAKAISDAKRGGDWAWWYQYNQRYVEERNTERVLAQAQTLELLDPSTANPQRYRRALMREISRANGTDYLYLFKRYRGFDLPMH